MVKLDLNSYLSRSSKVSTTISFKQLVLLFHLSHNWSVSKSIYISKLHKPIAASMLDF